MIKKYIALLSLILIFLIGCTKTNNPPVTEQPEGPDIPPATEEPNTPEIPEIDPIEELIGEMTLEEKIGQLIIVGLEGTEISELDILNIQENKVGGFIFFSRNIDNKDQVLALLNDLKNSNKGNKIPLFLSVDEEGGIVSRLSSIYKNLPSASNLGNKDDKELSFEYGELLGLKLSSLGFNIDFAPIMDINSNPNNPVIGKRAFGSTADVVVKHSIEVMRGIQSLDIIPVAKHFPGHGDTGVDSHLELPTVDKSYQELEELELIPFKAAIENGIDMIMVAHILYPQIDKDYPSTMSSEIIKNLLRDKLDYDGVVISDDMTMGAITDNYSLEEAVMKFLISGGDIALVCHGTENPSIVIDRIKSGIDQNEISIEDINEKVYRIVELKNKYKMEDIILNQSVIDVINSRVTDFNNKLN